MASLNEAFNTEGPEYVTEADYELLPADSPYVNNSPAQREAARQHCLSMDQRGGKNGRAKTWQITYKDGRVIVIKALTTWARENGYSKSGIQKLAYNHWKQYRDLKEIKLLTSKVPQ